MCSETGVARSGGVEGGCTEASEGVSEGFHSHTRKDSAALQCGLRGLRAEAKVGWTHLTWLKVRPGEREADKLE